MGSFADALDSTETRKGPQCSVCQLLERLEPGEDRDEIVAAIGSSDRAPAHVARALARFTDDTRWIGRAGSVTRHRAAHQ